MKVIVGLGNPGRAYSGTRHNVGFEVIDALAAAPCVGGYKSRFQAQLTESTADGLMLVKPETFMNLSGQSVRQIVDFYKLEIADLLVVCDDTALPLGKLRVRAKGSHGGHNGLRNILEHLGTNEYARLRVGVGGVADKDFVLGRFRPGERPVIADAIVLACQAVLVWSKDGVAACMNRFNGEPETKEKKKKPKDGDADNGPNKTKRADDASESL